jgi:AbiV family abortive infection protein
MEQRPIYRANVALDITLGVMQTLSVRELHALRLAIFDNAEALHREANFLLKNGMYSRAYLLAHFCFEELGKIPIVVGVIGQLVKGEVVDWKKAKKRFSNHEAKIASQNGHFYAFGLEVDLVHDKDLQWLLDANTAVPESYGKKNLSTYVDTRAGKILKPCEAITESDATKLVGFAFECLRAHWRSESLTNPIVYEAQDKVQPNYDA